MTGVLWLLVLAAVLNTIGMILLIARLERLERWFAAAKAAVEMHTDAIQALGNADVTGLHTLQAQSLLLTQLVNGHNHLHLEIMSVIASLPMRSALPPV